MILDDAALLRLGIRDPGSPFASTERRKNEPFDVRVRNDRVVRHESGAVEVFVGYYSPAAKQVRALVGRAINDLFHQAMGRMK